MHLLIKNLLRYREERHQIISAQHETERLEDLYRPKIEAAKEKGSPWDDYRSILSEYHHEVGLPRQLIDEIETRQRVRSAQKYQIPIPKKPEVGEDSEYWESSMFGDHVLTLEGHRKLRHDIAAERELVQKPVLSWIAVSVSLFSLLLSFLSLLLR
ncbi:hypothetical protein [Labrenzia sp. 011]|uniref:hypothetical protein n=1 Tax=Labrenzia sp. 011 TaxID=2171494 RepID=UPI000D524A19|nr:hypothetical protein [Labrenzia sp. 011]PVB60801.1 hypothetical protein DCO57_15410 [Labrenzia sp. 011]